MMGTVTLTSRIALALVFAIAALTKLPDLATSRLTFQEFGVSERLSRLAMLVAPAELAVVLGLVFVPTARYSAVAALLLLLIFVAGMVNALRLGRRPECGCFGGLRPTPIGKATLFRNGLLVVISAVTAATGPGPAIDQWLQTHSAGQIALMAMAVLTTIVGLTVGAPTRTRASDGATEQPFPMHAKPVVGSAAPEFSASGVDGATHTLASLGASGQPIVLVFGNAGCGSCLGLFSHLARWQATMAGRLRMVVVSAGDANQARLVRDQFGVTSVLRDDDGALAHAYGVRFTPTAVAVTAQGLIASGPAFGSEAIEDLIRLTLHREEPMFRQWNRTINAA
jgi:peroxiredoxin